MYMLYWLTIYLKTLWAAQTIGLQRQIRGWLANNDLQKMEGSGRGLISGTVLAFAWMGWGKLQKPKSGYPVFKSRFELMSSRIRSMSDKESVAMIDTESENHSVRNLEYGNLVIVRKKTFLKWDIQCLLVHWSERLIKQQSMCGRALPYVPHIVRCK